MQKNKVVLDFVLYFRCSKINTKNTGDFARIANTFFASLDRVSDPSPFQLNAKDNFNSRINLRGMLWGTIQTKTSSQLQSRSIWSGSAHCHLYVLAVLFSC
eukprot:4926977-Amphidinium_carterae.1